MSAVFSYRCYEGCRQSHLVPGKLGEQPPERVTCPNCGKECLRLYRTPSVSYRGAGWTGAQGNAREWKKGKA